METLTSLTKQHRLFVEAYDGDPIYAARVAGFVGADSYIKGKAEKLLKDPLILEAIKQRSKYSLDTKKAIATREERQALWTSIMLNEDPYAKEELDANNIPIPVANIPLATRLKASELLGKSEADFVDRVETTITHSLSELIQQSYLDDTPIEAIEAEYNRIKEAKQIQSPQSLEELI